MKKFSLLAAGLLITGITAFAQTTSTKSTSTVGSTKWGLKTGVNLAKYSFGADDEDNATTDHVTNFHVTGYLDLPLGGMFSVQPGLSLQGKGGESTFSSTGTGTSMTQNFKQNTMWLELPVNLVGKIPLGATGSNLFFGAGPYAALGLAGETKTKTTTTVGTTITSTNNTEDVNFGDDADKELKAMDFGINALAGFQLSNGFNIGAGYGLGLTDLRPGGKGNNGQQTNRVWSVSLGYSF